MKQNLILIKRNVKLFFKDKGMFFTSLITPAILLVLYATFLANIYRDSFTSALPDIPDFPEKIVNALVGGQLISSILAVSCVTVAFCSNFLMVQDKVSGALRDLKTAPIKPAALAMNYYAATLISSLVICFAATLLCLVYTAIVGWYMSVTDVLLLFADVFLLVLFGTALSSVINFFLSSQGQISAVGTIISAGYGFISGAYMPISSFGEGMQNAMALLPSTYSTSLVRNHSLRGAFAAMEKEGVPADALEGIKTSLDCNLAFYGNDVSVQAMYCILAVTVFALIGIYILLNAYKKKKD